MSNFCGNYSIGICLLIATTGPVGFIIALATYIAYLSKNQKDNVLRITKNNKNKLINLYKSISK